MAVEGRWNGDKANGLRDGQTQGQRDIHSLQQSLTVPHPQHKPPRVTTGLLRRTKEQTGLIKRNVLELTIHGKVVIVSTEMTLC